MNSGSMHLLEQYSHLEYLLLGDLRDLLEEPPDAENRKWLLAVLEVLVDMLPREHELTLDEGYMDFVRDRYPSWNRQIEQLERDHDDLYYRLRLLHSRVRDNEWIGPVASELRHELATWMDAIQRHKAAESDLVVSAVNFDLGDGD